MRGVLDPPVSEFSLSLYRQPFLYTLFSSRFTLIINNNNKQSTDDCTRSFENGKMEEDVKPKDEDGECKCFIAT